MDKLKIFLGLFLIFVISLPGSSQINSWNYLNFESGGYNTEIIPLKYPTGFQPSIIDEQVLYARTDVGGIYRSTNNGLSWTIVNNYYRANGLNPGLTISDLSIQGLAVRYNTNDGKQTLLSASGNAIEDVKPTQCIWRSNNSGDSWTESSIESPGIWFQGNNNTTMTKLGGPCIIYDPNHINGENSILYAGGYNPGQNGGSCHLFVSNDDGMSWTWNTLSLTRNFPSDTYTDEGIICIAMKEGYQDIWVGTTHRIVYTNNGGANWWTIPITGQSKPYVMRIILRVDPGDGQMNAFAIWGYYDNNFNAVTGIGKVVSGSYYPITNFGSTGNTLMTALTFGDNENVIFAGSYMGGGTLKRTANDGTSWTTQQLKYGAIANNNIPNHSIEYQNNPRQTNDPNIYDGMNCIVKNPNPGWSNRYYMGGGAGARVAMNDVINNDLSAIDWKYTVYGQAMVVAYDVSFTTYTYQNTTKNVVFIPISDWTMGWIYKDALGNLSNSGMIPAKLNYDRSKTVIDNQIHNNLIDTYCSNVTRILKHPNPNNDPDKMGLSYCVGGSIYTFKDANNNTLEDRWAGFYRRKDVDGSGQNFIYQRPTNQFGYLPDLLQHNKRVIVDAVIFTTVDDGTGGNESNETGSVVVGPDAGAFPIVALVGQTDAKQQPDPNDYLGVYVTLDGGSNWVSGSFDLQGEDNVQTSTAYASSQLPALINGQIGSLFSSYFSLCHIDNTNIVLLWLEQGANGTGGLFLSTNYGLNWGRKTAPSGLLYLNQGSLKYLGNFNGTNKIALAVKTGASTQPGLFIGDIVDDGNGGKTVSWENEPNGLGNFKSAEQIDYLEGKWAVFGKRAGDEYNQIYKSTNNGTNWIRIPENSNNFPILPQVNSLRISPTENNKNELWVATSGQGVWVYKNFNSCGNWEITGNETISSNFTFDCANSNIIVKNGGNLTISNVSQFKMASGSQIIIEPGGSLYCNNTVFSGNGANWNGILIESTAGLILNGCTFNDALKSISFSGYSGSRKEIKNSTFNVPNVTNAYGIFAENLGCCDFVSNVFNMSVSDSKGIFIENSTSVEYASGGEEDYHTPIYIIDNNDFNGGGEHLVINCLIDNLPRYNISYNRFNSTTGSNGTGVWARKITGGFSHNTFASGQFNNAITFSECYLWMLQNTINSKSNNLDIYDVSTVVLQPLSDGSGNYFWNAGKNIFTLENDNNSSNLSNVSFTNGCTLLGKEGENCFYLTSSYNNYHISGEVSSGDMLDFTINYWIPTTPQFNIINGSIDASSPSSQCNASGQISNNYEVINICDGYNDTLFITQKPGSGGQKNTDINPKYLFTECLKKNRLKQYSEAINIAKQIIDNYDSNRFFIASLDELYSNYLNSDTIRNQSARYSLFNSLKSYLEQKIQQYQNKPKFVDKAYRYYLMSKTKMKNYQEVITGYENIINNHPDPITRLTASWDRDAIILLMNGNGGGGQFENDEVDFETRFQKLMKEKPVHEVAYNIYTEMKNDYNDKKDNGLMNKADIENHKKIEKRVSVFTPSNKVQLQRKISEDINAILGLKKVNSSNSNQVPIEYSLSQNYPNPFNPVTKINYELPKDGKVKLVIYDILGREIKTLANEIKQAGKYTVEFNGSQLASGVYFYRIQVEGGKSYTAVKKMVLIK